MATITKTNTYIASNKGAGASGYVDTIAQSFYVERSMFLTKIDLYFQAKDASLPISLSLRNMSAGFPGLEIVTGSQVVVNSSDVNVSENASQSTVFRFDNPIYLESGEYCFVLTSDSSDYRVWISELGGTDVLTSAVISKQPYTGSFFKSQNQYTWTADQTADIKFKLYRANFTSSFASLDLVVDKNLTNFETSTLEYDPFLTKQGSSTVRVFHKNHGLVDGSNVIFSGLPVGIASVGAPTTKYSNILSGELMKEFTIANSTKDTYTISLSSSAAANVTTGRTGGATVTATKNIKYTNAFLSLSKTTPSSTSINHKVKTTSTNYSVDSSFIPVNYEDITFSTERLLVNKANRNKSMSGADSFVYRVELSSSDSYVSPVVNLNYAGLTAIGSDINNPTTSDNLNVDLYEIANSNVLISFTDTGIINFGGSNERANVKLIVPGSYITISSTGNSSPNYTTLRVLSVSSDGSSISIPSSNTEASGNAITVAVRPRFIDEAAATGSSSSAKYISRLIEFDNPSTALSLVLNAARPSSSSIEFWYKTRLIGENETFATKEFTQLDLGTIKPSVAGEFYEVEKFIDNLSAFDAVVFKIVLKTTDTAKVPKVKNLRLIALE